MPQLFSDEQFALIAPLFPKPRKPPTIPLRRCLEAIGYVLTTGCQWRKLPEQYREKEGDWHTIYTRYQRWSEKGLMAKIFSKLSGDPKLAVRIAFLDSTSIRAHHSAAGAVKKRGLKRSGDRKAD